MEFFMAHLTAYFFFNLSLTQYVSVILILVPLVCDNASVFFFCFCLSLKHTVSDCVSKDAEHISRSQVSENLSFNSVQRVWLFLFFHLDVHCIICFSFPELCLHTVEKFVPWWMLHKEHVFLAISLLQHPYISCKPGLSKCLLHHQQSYALSN